MSNCKHENKDCIEVNNISFLVCLDCDAVFNIDGERIYKNNV